MEWVIQMQLTISEFPLSHFQGLIPLLLRCFPEFWKERLARGLYSFPYDLTLFTGSIGDRMVACVGIHEYPVKINAQDLRLGGLCDVGVDPDFRGQGLAHQLQDFAIEYCRKKKYCAMPLYTDKPGVYFFRGWQLYESSREGEMSARRFPPQNTFSLTDACIDFKRDFDKMEEAFSPQLLRAYEMTSIYFDGRKFPGKCIRSEKTWNELFADPKHHWHLDRHAYFLYREERLLEAYSRKSYRAVTKYLPAQGGHDDNKVMIKILNRKVAEKSGLLENIASGKLIFPAADVF